MPGHVDETRRHWAKLDAEARAEADQRLYACFCDLSHRCIGRVDLWEGIYLLGRRVAEGKISPYSPEVKEAFLVVLHKAD